MQADYNITNMGLKKPSFFIFYFNFSSNYNMRFVVVCYVCWRNQFNWSILWNLLNFIIIIIISIVVVVGVYGNGIFSFLNRPIIFMRE